MKDCGDANIGTKKPKVSSHPWKYVLMLLSVVLSWVFNGTSNVETAALCLLVNIAYDVDCILCELRNKGN